MKKPTAPCKECKDRYEGCHGKCEAYIEYKRVSDDLREQEKRQKDVFRDYSIARAKRYGR